MLKHDLKKNNYITFSIENKDFFCDRDLLISDRFSVQSVPRSYEVVFSENNEPFTAISTLLEKNKKNLLIIDLKLLSIYNPILNIEKNRIFIAEASENFKSLKSVTNIVNFLQKNDFTKGEQLIVVGGGITQDIAAFASAIYKRGISWVYFPTTLLSMSDSCIGGKTSVNYNGVKNQLALFSSPFAIHINPFFLKTLGMDEMNSGLGEILKLCIIGGEYFIALYQQHVSHGVIKSFDSLNYLIKAALSIKKLVIEEDEFELLCRRSMNYGHTLGHAIESLSGYTIPHGQAVVIGMILANQLSYMQGLLSQDHLNLVNTLCFSLITKAVLAHLKSIDLNNIVDFIQKDKKTIGNYTDFVMLHSPGKICFVKYELHTELLLRIRDAFSTLHLLSIN